jgi:hypothetical protein
MAKTEAKTVETDGSVEDFLNAVEDEARRTDSFILVQLMEKIMSIKPKMWGTAIIGFGSYQYKYESGREGISLRVGFSPRKDSLAIYIGAAAESNQDLIGKLGKYKLGKSCLYVKKLSDIDMEVLEILIKRGFERKQFGEV